MQDSDILLWVYSNIDDLIDCFFSENTQEEENERE